jgi:hypothetical protein
VTGPGGELAPTSDPPLAQPPTLAGHPAAGWFLAAPPRGHATLTVAWDVPDLAPERADGKRAYSLRWPHLPGHTHDRVSLRVDLPEGWAWAGPPPPATGRLDRDLAGRG